MWDELWGNMAKLTGRHKTNQLTVKAIEAISKPGKYGDGNGLYLVADNKSAKRWLLRVMVQGKRCDIGLGSYRVIGLSDARDLAREYIKAARAGDDPRQTLRKVEQVPTFACVAQKYFEQNKEGWKSNKHRDQWIGSLEKHAFPSIGNRKINEISTDEIVTTLAPIWHKMPETAQRVKQRIATIFSSVSTDEYMTGPNPCDGVKHKLKVEKNRVPKHYRAMDYKDVPEFLVWLRADDMPNMTRLALEFVVLTACRTGELVEAQWKEIDTSKKLWVIPGERMKAGKPHRVPLTKRALDILAIVNSITGDGPHVFEGRQPSRPMSNMSMIKFLQRNNIPSTTHGFRTCFRMWAGEATGFPRIPVELCLAHDVRGSVEKSYDRSDHLPKRIEIMDAWQAFALSGINDIGNVVRLKTGA